MTRNSQASNPHAKNSDPQTKHPEQIHYRTCNICEASCGLEIHHRDGEILAVKGDAQDPLSQGYICPKGVALQDVQNDPDRLRRPIKKTSNGWQEISWPEALDAVADNIKQTQDRYGDDSVGLYIGNPTAHNHGALLMLAPFIAALNTRSRFSATSCDQLPHMLACLEMFGHFANFPIPDIDRTDFFLCLGANPVASNGSVMTAPNFKERIKRLKKRGGKFVVVDPRKTETAKIAHKHLFIKPGTDSLLLLAMLNVIFTEQLDVLGAAAEKVDGLEVLKQAVEEFTPTSVAAATGIDEQEIRTLTQDFVAANSAAAYGRVGVATSPFSGLNAWLIYVLNIVTGNLDREGGLMFPLPAIDLVGLAAAAGERGSFNRWQSRVRSFPEFAGEIPVVSLAEEILTEGPQQIRGMIIHAGNPVLSVPNGQEVGTALQQLDFLVCIDIYLNETTQHADLILPPTGPFEHGHYDLAMHTVAVRNTVKYSPALVEPPKDSLHDWEILAELTARLESKTKASAISARTKLSLIKALGDEGILDWLLRLGPYGKGFNTVHMGAKLLESISLLGPVKSLLNRGLVAVSQRSTSLDRLIGASAYRTDKSVDAAQSASNNKPHDLDLKKLKENPHGVDLGPLQPQIEQRIFTRSGKIQLSPSLYLNDLARLKADTEQRAKNNDHLPLLLIGRRHIRCNNSWMHNSQRLIKGKNRCDLMISEIDAEKLGLQQGDLAKLSSRVGSITLPVVVTAEIMPGVVSVPHGWGHDRNGSALRVAQKRPGVSVNDITDNQIADDLTGMAIINGVPVNVVAVSKEGSVSSEEEAVAS